VLPANTVVCVDLLLSSPVQWVISGPCWEMGTSLETTWSGSNTGEPRVLSRDHTLLSFLPYRFLCVGIIKSGKPCFILAFVL